MSAAMMDLLAGYKQSDDILVRLNLCHALFATGASDAASMLLDLAMNDDEEAVRILAADLLAQMDPGVLGPLQEGLADRFDPSKGKAHVLSWFRSADLIARTTGTPLTASFGGWWKEVRFTRKLNRRLLLSRGSGHGMFARLLNWRLWVAAIAAFALGLMLFWLMVQNPTRDFFLEMSLFLGFGIMFLGIPIGLIATPPAVSFRKSAAAFVDALAVIVLTLVIAALIFLFTAIIFGDTFPVELYWGFGVVFAGTLIFVRFALIMSITVPNRLVHIGLLGLVTIGTLVVMFGLAQSLWGYQRYNSWNAGLLEVMDIFLPVVIGVSLFWAIHIGISGDPVRVIGAARPIRRIRWMGIAGLGAVFLGTVIVSPGENYDVSGDWSEQVLELGLYPAEGTIPFERFDRIVLAPQNTGELRVTVTAKPRRDVTIWIDGNQQDQSRGTTERYRNDKEEKGRRVFHADLSVPTVAPDQLISYFGDQIAFFYKAYGFFGVGRSDPSEHPVQNVVFEMEYEWFPRPEEERPLTLSD